MRQSDQPRAWPARGLFLALLGGLLLGGGAAGAADTPACRRDCGATAGDRSRLPPGIQACLIRCQAASSFNRQQLAGRGSMRGIATPVPPPRRAAAAPRPAYAAVPGRAPLAAAAGAPHAAFGAIYAAAPPGRAVGLIAGQGDRLAAHRLAELECGRAGQSCRMLTEFTTACGAVAQGLHRSDNAMIMTDDARTYDVHAVGYGTGGTRQDAESAALQDCGRRGLGLTCRIARAACGG